MRILLIGPQGSGKSTQAELLAKHLDIPKISTGDIFREIAKGTSEEADKIRELQNSGNLVDDETTARIIEKRLQENDCKNGFILDGYPRNLAQKNLFDPDFTKVFYLQIDDEEIMRRLTARGRADDIPESIRIRLNLYKEQTQPLLDYYKNQGILVEIAGYASKEEIHDEIKKYI